MLSPNLEQTLHRALAFANDRRHDYASRRDISWRLDAIEERLSRIEELLRAVSRIS